MFKKLIEKHYSTPKTIIDKIDLAIDNFKKENNCIRSPWGYFCIRKTDNNNYWLNPANQQYISSEYVNETDIEDWLQGKGKIIKGDWDELVFICKYNLQIHINDKEHYNWYKPKYNPEMRICPRDGMLTSDDIKNIEQYWKFRIISEMQDEYDYHGKLIKNFNNLRFEKRRELQEEMFGYFNALKHLGLGSFQACNLPTNRENFSWWVDLIKRESEIEWLLKSDQIDVSDAKKYLGYNKK